MKFSHCPTSGVVFEEFADRKTFLLKISIFKNERKFKSTCENLKNTEIYCNFDISRDMTRHPRILKCRALQEAFEKGFGRRCVRIDQTVYSHVYIRRHACMCHIATTYRHRTVASSFESSRASPRRDPISEFINNSESRRPPSGFLQPMQDEKTPLRCISLA